MASFIWKTEMIQNLQKLYMQKDSKDKVYIAEQVENQLLESGILIAEESSGYHMEGTAELVIEILLTWDAHMSYECEGMEAVHYYFKDDWIVRAVCSDGEQELQLLPSITYVIGSVADLVWETVNGTVDCVFKKPYMGSMNENNYFEEVLNLVDEEKYKKALLGDQGQKALIYGETKSGYPGFFMIIKFIDGVACYCKQEEGKITYGENSRVNFVNTICYWMIYVHRDLINRLLEERKSSL